MLLALCSMTGAAETPGTSGIEGTILVSPSRPGPITRDDPGVAPARNVPFQVKTGDAVVKSFTTDGEGRFQWPCRLVITSSSEKAQDALVAGALRLMSSPVR